MSNTKSQHYIPQFHLRHFSKDGKTIIVTTIDGKQSEKLISKICCRNYIYDGNPNDKDSMEWMLQDDESSLGSWSNKVIKNPASAQSNQMLRYIRMMQSRSKNNIVALHLKNNNQDYRGGIKKNYQFMKDEGLLFGIDKKIAMMYEIKDSDLEFITSDNGFCMTELHRLAGFDDNNCPNELYGHWIIYCPISPKLCIICTEKDDIGKETLDQLCNCPPDTFVKDVNILMIMHSDEYVLSRNPVEYFMELSKTVETYGEKIDNYSIYMNAVGRIDEQTGRRK